MYKKPPIPDWTKKLGEPKKIFAETVKKLVPFKNKNVAECFEPVTGEAQLLAHAFLGLVKFVQETIVQNSENITGKNVCLFFRLWSRVGV